MPLTFGDVLEMAKIPIPTLVQNAVDKYVGEMGRLPYVQEIYAMQWGDGARFFTRVSEGDRNEIYDAELKIRQAYPILHFGFRRISTSDIPREQIERFREVWVPGAKLVYQR